MKTVSERPERGEGLRFRRPKLLSSSDDYIKMGGRTVKKFYIKNDLLDEIFFMQKKVN